MKKILFSFSLLCVCQMAFAGDALVALRSFVSNTKTLTGIFVQNNIDKKGVRTENVAYGDFTFERPGKFAWNTRTPFAQEIVSDAKKLWLYEPDLNQVTVKDLKKSIASTPAAILFGTGNIEENFSLNALGSEGGIDWVIATPRVDDMSFSSIALGFKGEDLTLMRLTDHFGETTEYYFRGVTVNGKVLPENFLFKIPKGADVFEDKTLP